MSARKTIRGSENIALFYVFLFQRRRNESLTIINLYSLGETSLWEFYWWHCLTEVSLLISAVFNLETGGTIPAIAQKRTGSSLLMLAVNFGLGEG